MQGRWMGLALVVAVGTAPAFADNARPRGGGSSGGHSTGSSHHSGGGGGSHRSGGGSSYSGSSGGGAHPRTGAAARHPRAGTGTGPRYYRGYGHHGYGYGYGYPYYGYPYYYNYWPYWGASYWYSPYYYGGYGYGGYGYGGYGYGDGPAYSYGYNDESGAVRTFVEPSETKVHVDGRYAGTADDFDGLMQRLYVSPGAHELVLSLEGYKTHRVKIYVSPGGTLKLHHDMVKGSGEDAEIATLGNPEDERYGKRERRYYDDEEDDDADSGEVRRDDDARAAAPRAGLSWGNELGTVRLAIQPGDASVYVDGQFRGPANGLRSLRLSPGRHHIEVVRPGFRTEERDVDVRDGEDTTLELELPRS